MADLINVTTKMFFDRDKVVNAMDRKTHQCLSSAGAFARTVMKRGMRRRKKISQPGEYPSAHAGQLRDLIYFGFDGNTKTAVIGPKLYSGKDTAQRNKTIPQLINEGGTVVRAIRQKNGTLKRVTQQYQPRPFVGLTAPIAAAKLAENMEKFDLK